MNIWLRKSLCALLCLCLALAALPALAQSATEEATAEDGETVRYIATASAALKVRRSPSKSSGGVGSLSRGETVYVLALGAQWSYVRMRNDGYVLTSYLDDIREYDPDTKTIGDPAVLPSHPLPSIAGASSEESGSEWTGLTGGTGSVVDAKGFYLGYSATTVKGTNVYKGPGEDTGYAFNISTYKEVVVGKIEGEWCPIRYNGKYGYTKVSNLFKWDKIDPYVGDIPGAITYSYMAFLKRTVDVIDIADGKTVLTTLSPGSAVCVEPADEQGRYRTPYWRKTGYITQDDIAMLLPVVDWAEAQAGDLISVMSTYYAVGIHTLQYQGRNWNIYLGSTYITGTVLQPGEVYNQNKIMGPYRKATGYHLAPIASPNASEGYGGGTCQVNTTMYNAIIRLPLYVNHRKVHSNVGAKYMLKGFDAAVGGNDINLIFTNTLSYPIRFVFWVTDGVMTCAVYRAE